MAGTIKATVGSWLKRAAQQEPDHEALVHHHRGVRYSYRNFLQEVERLARGFLSLGVRKGDPVALWASNQPEWLTTQFALAEIGAMLVALDPGYGQEELHYALSHARAKILVMAEGPGGSYLEMVSRLSPELGRGSASAAGRLPDLAAVITLSPSPAGSFLSYQEVLKRGEEIPLALLRERELSLLPEDPLMLLYTSGTTGKPKGVVLDHRGVLNKSLASTERLGLMAEDRLCLFFPLFHMFGNTCIALAGLIRGATLVIPSDQFSPPEILSALVRERCTAIYGSPSMMVALLETPAFKEAKIETLRTGIIGGAPCPLEVMNRVVKEMGVREIAIAYGITEASSWLTQTLPDDPPELRVSTIGKALPNCEVKVIDPLTGEEAPVGRPGELCTRGFLMKGYFQDPEATARAVDREGWFHTGDLGVRDSLGYFRITGRLKEVIVKEGHEILPTEIEEALYRLPGAAMVAAFGLPDAAKGEVIAVWISLKEGAALSEEAVAAACREHLPEDHRPDYIRFVKAFPMTRSGKIQKFNMREMMIEMLKKGL